MDIQTSPFMPHVNFELRYSLPWGIKLKFGQGAVIFEPASAFGLSLFYFDPIFMNPFANEHKLVLVSGAGI